MDMVPDATNRAAQRDDVAALRKMQEQLELGIDATEARLVQFGYKVPSAAACTTSPLALYTTPSLCMVERVAASSAPSSRRRPASASSSSCVLPGRGEGEGEGEGEG